MAVVYALFALAICVPAFGLPVLSRRVGPVAVRVRTVTDALIEAVGRVPAALLTLFAGAGAIVAVCWPLGEGLSRLEPMVDRRVFAYVAGVRDDIWERLNSAYTVIGDRAPLKWVTVIAAITFAVLWGRRWWIPAVAMLGQFPLEQYTQEILKKVVDRGHPPTDLGTYPSGGCARVLLTFGTILVLASFTWQLSRTVRVTAFTALAVADVLEGYTRIYVQKHWLTDVIGGWIFGSLLLAVVAVSIATVAGRIPATTRPELAEATR
jgi:membrane-associated phospholipid phosphatase